MLGDVLEQAGYRIVEAPTPRRERGRGKTDGLDAALAARSTMAVPLSMLRDRRAGQAHTALQVLTVARDQLNADRLRCINALTALARSHDLGVDARRALTTGPPLRQSVWPIVWRSMVALRHLRRRFGGGGSGVGNDPAAVGVGESGRVWREARSRRRLAPNASVPGSSRIPSARGPAMTGSKPIAWTREATLARSVVADAVDFPPVFIASMTGLPRTASVGMLRYFPRGRTRITMSAPALASGTLGPRLPGHDRRIGRYGRDRPGMLETIGLGSAGRISTWSARSG